MHPVMSTEELNDLVWKLAKHHGYKSDQNAIVFQAENKYHRISSQVHYKNLHLETLFEWPSTDSYHKVSHLPGYPFALAIGWPPYHNYFYPDYPHAAPLPMVVTFIHHTLQLLTVGGLLFVLATQNEAGWPTQELNKIAEKIDEYVLPPVFGQSEEHALMVFRRRATDAVRYE
ncbi:hypothetical protein [Marivirga atlantica]|uniref:Uncharacterized protein n=1 Tax=Marivirga atlantica TaxID=1548457 RepID=A0A937DLG6_9BACT|nr:hypothetical protein [Marivirga atlantica]MBL0767089.1 hypothetical protein [Marivirga atlantica]